VSSDLNFVWLQRLEFLGDAVLDLLITKHLFFSHPGLTPGRLTDLRSAAVNNECFARVAVKHKFNKYIRHGSGFLLKQIEDFVVAYHSTSEDLNDSSYGWDGVKGPKARAQLIHFYQFRSIVGYFGHLVDF
jgi:endoribonuclease Dicer